ncbi:MAG: DUF2156 domain-containing protein [Chloroflexi bacterium]|nr:DUF2156 domain-containing protein [Chloroflexota bacterium]MDA1272033.1 DUF2156 domain-containing protein [Chloroflexota bacterium]
MIKQTDEMTDRERAQSALARYGYQSQSYNILTDGKSYFFSSAGIDGVISYVAHAGMALAAGDPVCRFEDLGKFAAEFRQFCTTRKWRCCFQAVTERCEHVLDELGFGAIKIGEEPIFDLSQINWSGGHFKGLRGDINSAKRKGLSVVEYQPLVERRPDLEAQMEELSRQWQEFKGSHEFSFLIGSLSLADPVDRKFFIALRGEEVEAFVVCTPIYARNGIYFDLMRRKASPVAGTSQLLITEAFRLLSEQGFSMATLGTAPLANENVDDPDQNLIVELAMRIAFNSPGYFHRYKPLYQFKDQFGPSAWESRYLAYWPNRFHPVIVYALLKAYDPSGVSGQLKRQLQAAWKAIQAVKEIPQALLQKIIER